jgi:DNA (cytosine-5)-methyltransferase 1
MRSHVEATPNVAVVRKLERLAAGHAPRVLDLFSGCGGISLGFSLEGFEVAAAVDSDPEAIATHARNFHAGCPEPLVAQHMRPRDILATEPATLAAELQLGEVPALAIDVIVGGPPCQSFARVGRAKLREVLDHPEAFRQDTRSQLYLRYLDYVREFRPLALLVENVPDVINHGGHNVPQEMCEALGALGYRCRYTLLNAAHYGVPQMRDRMFLLAFAQELDEVPVFPEPSHAINLPRGYYGTRSVALKHVQGPLLSEDDCYVDHPASFADLPPAVTAAEALGDLPPITRHLRGELKRGPARFDTLARYRAAPGQHPYCRMMREWPGYESREGVYDHVIRCLPRDYPIFARMRAGDQYPQAHAVATAMFEEELGRLQALGERPVDGSAEWDALRRRMVPPYDPGKFPNKWRKMAADEPSRTVMAHIGKDSYSHIHYDSKQARTISVREAARIQSFPDGFRFVGRMNAAFRQIGNAVPPVLAAAIATEVHAALHAAAARSSAAAEPMAA